MDRWIKSWYQLIISWSFRRSPIDTCYFQIVIKMQIQKLKWFYYYSVWIPFWERLVQCQEQGEVDQCTQRHTAHIHPPATSPTTTTMTSSHRTGHHQPHWPPCFSSNTPDTLICEAIDSPMQVKHIIAATHGNRKQRFYTSCNYHIFQFSTYNLSSINIFVLYITLSFLLVTCLASIFKQEEILNFNCPCSIN